MRLIIDTSTKNAGIALWSDDRLVRTTTWQSRKHHTVELMPAIQRLLEEESMAPNDLKAVAVAIGPGGFSALRAGISVAKGLGFALSIPVSGINTLEAAAYPYRHLGHPICSILQLGRDLVSWARFNQSSLGWTRMHPDKIGSIETLLEQKGRHTIFCGEGLYEHREELTKVMGQKAHLAGEATAIERLLGIALLSNAQSTLGTTTPLASLQAHYLRAPRITEAKAPRPIILGSPQRKRRSNQ